MKNDSSYGNFRGNFNRIECSFATGLMFLGWYMYLLASLNVRNLVSEIIVLLNFLLFLVSIKKTMNLKR